MDTLRDNLITIASHYNLNQRQLGELLNVNCQAVNHWMAGRNSIPLERLMKLSKYTGISLDALCFIDLDFDTEVPKRRVTALKYNYDVLTRKIDCVAEKPANTLHEARIKLGIIKKDVYDLGKHIDLLCDI